MDMLPTPDTPSLSETKLRASKLMLFLLLMMLSWPPLEPLRLDLLIKKSQLILLQSWQTMK